MITRERVEEILRASGVLMEGHFLLTSGRHSDKYMQCAKVFRHAKYSEELCAALAELFAGEKIDVVIGPAMGAVQMAYEVSRAVGCENFFTERGEDGKMVLRRGFEVTPGMRCLLVEDVVTTGGSVKEVKELVEAAGGVVVGIGSLVDRSNGGVDFGVPFKAVYPMEVVSWDADECPLCREGKLPAVKPGSRKAPGAK